MTAEIFAFHRQDVAPVRFDDRFGGWVVTRYSDVDRVLTDHGTFSSDEVGYSAQPVPHKDNPVLGSLMSMDPPRHHELRRIVSQVFTPRAVAALEPVITSTVAEFVTGGDFDLIGDVAYPLSVHTIAGLLGVDHTLWPDFVRWSEAITSFAGLFAADEARQVAFREAVAELSAYFTEEFQRPRGIIATLREADLTAAELINFCTLLLINGHETTKTLLVNAVLCIADVRPPAEALPTVIEEVLRFLPPTGGTDRFVTQPTVIDGHDLKPGDRVVAMITAANRDPEVFADPHTFDPNRSPNPHLSFGHGIHFCMGAHLARLETRLALTALLDHPWRIADVDTDRTPVGIDVLKLTLATGPRPGR